MHGTKPVLGQSTSLALEAKFQRWQNFSEPLWFAVMCREVWGPNAPKELQFVFGDRWSDRTYRAWASGDSIPQSDVLVVLLLTPLGQKLLDYITRDGMPKWRADELEDQRQAAIFRSAMCEVSSGE